MLKDFQKHKPNHVNYTSQRLRLCRSQYVIRDHLRCLEHVCLQTFYLSLFAKSSSVVCASFLKSCAVTGEKKKTERKSQLHIDPNLETCGWICKQLVAVFSLQDQH